MQYTAIYVENWMVGSHRQSLTKIKRVETLQNESVKDCLEREGIWDITEYLFEGWPKLQGEN